MKILWNTTRWTYPPLQFDLKMKLTTLLLLTTLFGLHANDSYAQKTKITLDASNSTIASIIDEIEATTEFRFVYNHKFVDVDRKVSIKVKRERIDQVMELLFGNTDTQYRVIRKQVVLSAKPQEDEPILEGVSVIQDPIQVTGRITDESGVPLPGANIIEKGTTNGVTADFDGNFYIEVSNENAILIISYIGYATKEVAVNGQSSVDAVLQESSEGLDEVVVIGYGTQKKINLTGSVAKIDNEELNRRPLNNVANMLQGRLTGVQINQGSGQPGKENTFIRIRGTGTFSGAGSNPLVIIDGIAGSLNDIDPENVESISVLKDAASAAIYGARAANGVVVVATKTGKSGDVSVTYHGNTAYHSATILPDFVTNSVEYMEMWNQAHSRQGIPILFTQEQINAYRNAAPDDPQYPNFNWLDHSFNTVPVQRHTLSVSGGSAKTRFYANIGYWDQKGIVIGHNFERYTGQLNLDTKITDRLTFGANISMAVGKRKEPWLNDSDFILLAYGGQPLYTPYLADGSGRYSHNAWPEIWANRNPELVANEGGRFQDTQNFRINTFLKYDILPELTWEVRGAVNFNNEFEKWHIYPVDAYSFATGELYSNGWPFPFSGVRDRFDRDKLPTFFTTLNYKKAFSGGHNLSILAGYNQEYFKDRFLEGTRRDFNFPQLAELNAGPIEGQSVAGSAREWAIQSYFGRVGYNYKEKYFVEANARYDGTSRIFEDNRWGFFPSVSAAWRVSQEGFMQRLGWMDNLKIRASWGQLGNQNIGTYPFQDILSARNYPLGAGLEQGLVQNRLTDKTLEWETTTTTDIGLDLSLGNGLFSMVFDWYKKETEGILSGAEIPASVGLGAPTINFASMENEGIELLLAHKNKIGELSYSIDFNYSRNRNEVTKVRAPILGRNSTVEGRPINTYYLVEWDGIFQSQAEIDAAPDHPGDPQPGDLRFKDANGDGVIDADDRVFVDGALPDFTYGGNITLQWKNWDMSLFLQGVEGQKYYLTWWGFWPFTQGTAPTTDWRNAWTPENPSQTMPALWTFSTYGYVPMTAIENTFDLQDASYLRLKNLQIGYNLPKTVCEKIRMDGIRLYFSGDNLFTWTKMKHVDPERLGTQWQSTRGSVFPQTKILSMGVKLTL